MRLDHLWILKKIVIVLCDCLIVFKMNLKPCLQLGVIVIEFITHFTNVLFSGDASGQGNSA